MATYKLGDTFEHEIQYTQEQVNQFMEVSGDRNPVHHDAEYAAKTVFKKPIIHGFLAGSVFSKVFGTLFPGEGTIYMEQNMQFRRPMYVDTPYVAKFKIVEHDEEKQRAKIETLVEDANGKATIKGTAFVMNQNYL